MVLEHSEVGEKLQRVACRGEVVDGNFFLFSLSCRKTVVKFLNCLKLTVIYIYIYYIIY